MESACLRHTDLPNTSRLFTDFLYHYNRVKPFYEGGSQALNFPPERRAGLVAALREKNGDSPSLDMLAQPETVAVITGQQVGLFSGPAYTIYKALTAVRLARELTAHGTPAVPVFWLATEDHDFAEVNHAWVFDAANNPVALRVDGNRVPDQPVGDIEVASWPIAELRAALSGLPFAGEVLQLVEESCSPGMTMGVAFHQLLKRLLSPYGMLFVDPMQPSIRRLAAPILRQVVGTAPELTVRLLERNHELSAAGYHAQVHIEEKTSLVFLLEGNRRIALRRVNGDYMAKDTRLTPAELAARAEHLSPNAILRPVVQDYIFPTAAYIGGPAELAYFAQSQVIYERVLGRMPRLVSRAGFTLLDARSSKLMARYQLRPQDFFAGHESLKQQIAHRLAPADVQLQFAEATAESAKLLDQLEMRVSHFDPTLVSAIARSRSKVLYQFSKSEAKVERELMRRNDRAAAEAEYLYNGIYPHKHLQERFYSILPFLARHGLALIDHVYENVRLDCPDHILLPV
ncbi:MAG TPA: bacillithiol biosynthesis cysteine-adding enzyme BshC [Bryobacteraceae bacterium]|nr:bacillithiol biosynthesis cysteine-adding enzyme BshC [Bryobacteraceae bacterium]